MNSKAEARFWSLALVFCACAWFASSDTSLRTFFATVSGFATGSLLCWLRFWFANRRRPS